MADETSDIEEGPQEGLGTSVVEESPQEALGTSMVEEGPQEALGTSVVEEGPLGARLETNAPFLRVVKGDPTPEELAALVAVLAAVGGAAAPTTRRTPEWNAPRRLHRVAHHPGPGGWRASALPR